MAEAPGEFTRLFESGPPAPAQPPAVHRPPAERPVPSQPQPSALPPPPQGARPSLSPPPAPESKAETGEFTRLFGSRLPGEAIDIEKEHARASLAAPPGNRPFQAAGEFTRMFGPEGAKSAKSASTPGGVTLPPSIGTPSLLSSASGMFGDPDELAKLAAEALAGGKTADSAPDEYAQLFDAPRKPQEPSKPAAPAAPIPEAVPTRKSNRNLVVIVVSVFVLVALIVVVILLRR